MRAIDGDALKDRLQSLAYDDWNQGVTTSWADAYRECADMVEEQPTIEPTANSDKYEYHYDHTDCIWYRPEARNRCPSTCAQYRDGWNDAMNYIFRDGKGYRPYRRDKQYEERKEGAGE